MDHHPHVDLAVALMEMRLTRRRFFTDELFDEFGWNMMLSLYVAEARGTPVTETELIRRSGAPEATGRRWVKILAENGYLEVEDAGSPSGGISLSERQSDAVAAFLDETHGLLCTGR